MPEQKRNPNPFIRMAQEAAKAKEDHLHQTDNPHKAPQKQNTNKGYHAGGANVQRRSARGR